MPAALQCYNSSGNLQIDTQFMNMVLVMSGKITINAPANPPNTWGSVTNIQGLTNPILVCHLTGATAGQCPVIQMTQGWNPELNGGSGGYAWNWTIFTLVYSGSVQVSWYIYDVVPNVTPPFGLVTYNSSGRVTFSSDYEPLRIIGLANIPYGTPNEGYTPSTYTINGTYSGQKLAIGFSNMKSYTTSDGAGGAVWYMQDAYCNNAGSVPYVQTSTYYSSFGAPTSAIGTSQPYGGTLFAVDVTNVVVN